MQVSTRGIVLHKTKYSESSVIVNIFTREAGVQSFMVKGAFSKRNRTTLAVLENLSLVELKYEDKGQDLKFIQDISLYYSYSLVPFDMVRRSLFIFYNELIYKLLREYQADTSFYDFIEKSILELDAPDTVLTDVHLKFMVRLAKEMGLSPEANYSAERQVFSIDESCFVHEYFDYPNFLSRDASLYLWQLMQGAPPADFPPKVVRNELLFGLIRYFEQHNTQIGRLDSVEILSQLLGR